MSASGNCREWDYRSTPQRTMLAYDKLPPEVRRALAESIENWATQPVLTRMKLHRMNGEELAAFIRENDAMELERRESMRRRAAGPYSGNVPDRTAVAISRRRRRGAPRAARRELGNG